MVKKWNWKGYNLNNIIYEIKKGTGFIKEYDNISQIILKFEGEYINDERNGKGKEYNNDNDELIFEGEYLKGEKLNGKFYNSFEGELKNGKGYVKKSILIPIYYNLKVNFYIGKNMGKEKNIF